MNSKLSRDGGQNEDITAVVSALIKILQLYPRAQLGVSDDSRFKARLASVLAPDADLHHLEPYLPEGLRMDPQILFRARSARLLLRKDDMMCRCTLRHGGDGWRLVETEMWCPACLGTGLLNEELCEFCFGEGWGSHGSDGGWTTEGDTTPSTVRPSPA